jgi:hypothetical protein
VVLLMDSSLEKIAAIERHDDSVSRRQRALPSQSSRGTAYRS